MSAAGACRDALGVRVELRRDRGLAQMPIDSIGPTPGAVAHAPAPGSPTRQHHRRGRRLASPSAGVRTMRMPSVTEIARRLEPVTDPGALGVTAHHRPERHDLRSSRPSRRSGHSQIRSRNATVSIAGMPGLGRRSRCSFWFSWHQCRAVRGRRTSSLGQGSSARRQFEPDRLGRDRPGADRSYACTRGRPTVAGADGRMIQTKSGGGPRRAPGSWGDLPAGQWVLFPCCGGGQNVDGRHT
jgi:hypothetical protein